MDQETKNLSSVIIDALRVKGISVEKLSNLTGVSEASLGALIEEKFEKLPPAPYVHGYLMRIGDVLNLDGKKLWGEYLKNNELVRRSGEKDHLPQNRFALPRLGKKFFWVGIIASFVVIYLVSRVFTFYVEPKITFSNLTDDMRVTSQSFVILGNTDQKNQLTLNNEPVYLEKNGNFEKEITLEPGFNTLNFKVQRLFGKEYVFVKQIFYEMPIAPENNINNDQKN